MNADSGRGRSIHGKPILPACLMAVLITVIAASCEPAVTFTEPQPRSAKDMSEFPARWRGDYRSMEDSSVLHITAYSISRIDSEGDGGEGEKRFSIGPGNRLRRFKGCLFLSMSRTDGGWEVVKLQRSGDLLNWSFILTRQELESLQEITEAPEEAEAPPRFSPSRKEMRRFLKEGGFATGETFLRIR